MSDKSLEEQLADKLGVFDTAQDSKRFNGMTFEDLLEYIASSATVRNTLGLGGLSVEALLQELRSPEGRVLDADRLNGRTVDDLINEVKNRIREASHPYMVIPLSRGGWSRLVTIPSSYYNEYSGNRTVDEDLLFLLIGGGPYGFLAERPVAYLRIGREGRPPIVNVLSGRYTIDFYYRKVMVDGVEHTEIWCGEAARNDFQIVLLGGVRGCQFGVKERPQEEKPEGVVVPIRCDSVVHRSYADRVLAEMRAEIDTVRTEIEALKSAE